MKKLVSIIFAIALVGAGTVVGWEARNWHMVIKEWYIKAGAYDFVGSKIMDQIMYEIAKKRLEEQGYQPPQKIKVDDQKKPLPEYPPIKRGQIRA